jgi:hypothetical protein
MHSQRRRAQDLQVGSGTVTATQFHHTRWAMMTGLGYIPRDAVSIVNAR